jgi:hypothetical protein
MSKHPSPWKVVLSQCSVGAGVNGHAVMIEDANGGQMGPVGFVDEITRYDDGSALEWAQRYGVPHFKTGEAPCVPDHARLIAAAPDLYHVAAVIRDLHESGAWHCPDELLEILLPAVAKAEGSDVA